MKQPDENKMYEANPPELWDPPTPPTSLSEKTVLEDEFGEPDENGVYAPYVGGA